MKKYEVIHERALSAAKRFRVAEAELLGVLQEVEKERVYLQLGYSSMHEYGTGALKLSEANASNFITVARKSMEIPELKLAVEEGRFSVTKARKITPVINKSNATHWIGLATILHQRALEKEVANANPETPKPDHSRPVGNDRVELKFGVTDAVFQTFKRVQDLECQRTQKLVNFEGTLKAAIEFYITEKDSLTDDAGASVAATHSRIRVRILVRDKHRCTFKAEEGRRCKNTRWLDVHHIIPRSAGGSDDPENLTTLCTAHHRLLHRNSTL